jgi:hypothetical protein
LRSRDLAGPPGLDRSYSLFPTRSHRVQVRPKPRPLSRYNELGPLLIALRSVFQAARRVKTEEVIRPGRTDHSFVGWEKRCCARFGLVMSDVCFQAFDIVR